MKNLLCILLCCSLLTACSNDKRMAPKEGRIALSPQTELQQTKNSVQMGKIQNPSEWLHTYQNAQNNRPHTQSLIEQEKLWTTDIGTSYSEHIPELPLVVSKDMIYTLDGAFNLNKIDKKTGQIIWHKKLSQNTEKGIGLTTNKEQIFVISDQGKLIALKTDGEIAWQKELNTPIRTTPTFDNKLLFILSQKNILLALDQKTGKEIWRYQTTATDTFLQGMAHPALSKGILVVPFTTGEVITFDAASGMVLWGQMMIGNQLEDLYVLPHILASPIINENTVYLAGNANLLGAYNLQTGKTKWTHNIGSITTPILSGNALFVLAKDHHLLAIEANTGRIFWNKEMPHDAKTAWQNLELSNNQLILRNNDKYYYVDPKNGEIKLIKDKTDSIISPITIDNTTFGLTKRAKLTSYQQGAK